MNPAQSGAPIPRHPRQLTLAALAGALAFSVGGCSGNTGHIDLTEASVVERVVVHAPKGVIHIVGNDDTIGIVGTHGTSGFGARGPARVHLDADGVMHIEAPCAPVLPCALDLSLAVAPSTELVVDIGSGEVNVEGLDKADIQIDRGTITTAGSRQLVARVGQGSVMATPQSDAQVQAVVASGDVVLVVPPGGWRIDAAAARLQVSGVAMDRRATGQLSVHAPSGAVRIVGSDPLASR